MSAASKSLVLSSAFLVGLLRIHYTHITRLFHRRRLKAYEEPFPFVSPQFKMYECIR